MAVFGGCVIALVPVWASESRSMRRCPGRYVRPGYPEPVITQSACGGGCGADRDGQTNPGLFSEICCAASNSVPSVRAAQRREFPVGVQRFQAYLPLSACSPNSSTFDGGTYRMGSHRLLSRGIAGALRRRLRRSPLRNTWSPMPSSPSSLQEPGYLTVAEQQLDPAAAFGVPAE